jgi:hypothetical protein
MEDEKRPISKSQRKRMSIQLEKSNGYKERWANHSKVKCDCGHYPKDHFNREGGCLKCACTWYYPNHKYITKMKKKKGVSENF